MRPKTDFKKWLEQLQQQSWELELLISGFSIFLLVQTGDPLQDYRNYLDYHLNPGIYLASIRILLGVIVLGRTFLIFNLILHVLLRGLWIATIGLRYVSGEIDIPALRYSERFTRYLQRKMPDFDDYIEFLEKLCSVIFAFTFVIIFSALSAALFLVYFILFAYVMTWATYAFADTFMAEFVSVFFGLFLLGFTFSLLIYFIDFITFGRIKKWEFISVIYLPIYKVLGYLSLSFLYRPLIYNMIDNRFGRRIGYLMVPYIGVGLLLASLHVELNFFKPKDYSGSQSIASISYDDLLAQSNAEMKNVTIPTRYIDGDYLELFFRIKPKSDERTMAYLCPDYLVDRKSGLLIGDFVFKVNGIKKAQIEQDPDAGLNCWESMYRIQLDTTDITRDVDFHYYTHPQYNLEGVLGLLDISEIQKGKHSLHIQKHRLNTPPFSIDNNIETKLDTLNYARIHFWK